jgi:hypothetical protein
MTDRTLSSTTQEIYDAFNRIGLYNEPSFNTDRKALAAALRSLAKQVGYDNYHVDGDHGLAVVNVRDILAIADELEAQ